MAHIENTFEVRLGPQGRLVIPAALRRVLNLQAGQALIAHVEDGRIVLEPPDAVVARLKSRLEKIPAEVSLVDELIAERQQESRRDARE